MKAKSERGTSAFHPMVTSSNVGETAMADADEKRWEERLKRVAKHKDVPVPPREGPLRLKPGKGE